MAYCGVCQNFHLIIFHSENVVEYLRWKITIHRICQPIQKKICCTRFSSRDRKMYYKRHAMMIVCRSIFSSSVVMRFIHIFKRQWKIITRRCLFIFLRHIIFFAMLCSAQMAKLQSLIVCTLFCMCVCYLTCQFDRKVYFSDFFLLYFCMAYKKNEFL